MTSTVHWAPSTSQVRNARAIVRQALLKNWGPGRHITEMELAEALGLSRSPVRAAMHYLARLGMLKSKRNQGYILTMDRSTLSKLSFDPVLSSGDTLYLRIIDDKIHNRLADSFTHAELSALYKAGRPGLLHALNRMESEGLIERKPGRGWRFLPGLGTIQSRQASYEFRLAIEPRAILTASYSIVPDECAALQEAHHGLLDALSRGTAASDWAIDVDFSFHETIARWSGNQFFVNAVIQQNRLRRLFEFSAASRTTRVAAWCQEHLKVIAAIQRRDHQGAASLMEAHLISARDAT